MALRSLSFDPEWSLRSPELIHSLLLKELFLLHYGKLLCPLLTLQLTQLSLQHQLLVNRALHAL